MAGVLLLILSVSLKMPVYVAVIAIVMVVTPIMCSGAPQRRHGFMMVLGGVAMLMITTTMHFYAIWPLISIFIVMVGCWMVFKDLLWGKKKNDRW